MKIEEIKPDYRKQPPQSQNHPCGFFFPPNQSDALTTGSKYLFRYRDPVFREVAPSDPVRGQLTEPYGAATVFSQATDTAHLLAVPFDARTRDIRGTDYNWRCLGFEHIPVQNRGTGTYASLDFVGEKKCLPAVVSAWKKLIPPPYRYQQTDDNGNPIPSETTCAGLIGSLPLLVALAAFSAQPSELPNALTTSRSTTGHWVPHSYNTGRQSLPPLALTPTKPTRYTRAGIGRHNI